MRFQLAVAAIVATLATPVLALTQVNSPDAAYKTATFLLGAPLGTVSSVSDLNLTVGFSIPMERRDVGVNWSTWGSPPDTESSTPSILYTRGASALTFTFSKDLSTWGFEAEPNPFSLINFTVDYYDGATLVGSIARAIDGNGGARLLAATGARFDRAVVTAGSDFAIANMRYTIAVIPEPTTWAMLIGGFTMVGFAARRRRAANVAA